MIWAMLLRALQVVVSAQDRLRALTEKALIYVEERAEFENV